MRKAKDINPNAILIISFFDAKSKELANIFSTGLLPVRREAYDLITMMDPSNQATYAKMIKN
jgi:predicted transcriptional regulator